MFYAGFNDRYILIKYFEEIGIRNVDSNFYIFLYKMKLLRDTVSSHHQMQGRFDGVMRFLKIKEN